MDCIDGNKCTTQKILAPSGISEFYSLGMSGKWLMCYTGDQVYRIDTTNVANIELVPNITYVSSTVWTYIIDDDIVINGWYFLNGEPKLYVRDTPDASYACFTSKIKCSECGMSYRRSGKRQRKNPDEVYYIWICRSESDKGAKACSAKSIPEKTLKKCCTAVLDLSEFNEDIFLDKIEKIVVVGDDQLDFYFYDGHIVNHKWKSTARTDCWSDERRKAWSELHKGKNFRKKDQNPFTGYFRCPNCGGNFRRQSITYVDGTKFAYWHCVNGTSYGNKSKLPEETAKQFIADAAGTPEFDADTFHDKIEAVYMTGTYEATIHMKDGSKIVRTWEPLKRRGHKHTEEYKEHMRQLMKERWSDERKQEMSDRMKKIRSEKYWSSTGK